MNDSNVFRVIQLKDGIPYGEVDLRAVIGTVLFVTCLCMGSATYAGEIRTPLSGPADAPALQISFEHGLLSLAARGVSWTLVLDGITKETGIRFRSTAPLSGSVSVSIEPLPVRQFLERLLGPGGGFICRYAAGFGPANEVPREVWILGAERYARAETRSHDSGPRENETRSPSFDPVFDATLEPDEPLAMEGQTETDNTERAEIEALVQMAEAEDPGVRVQALSALGDRGVSGDDQVRSILEAALADGNAGVRGQALQALAVRGGGEATKYLKQALADPDPGVRMVVVERTEPKDEGIALLQEALADADEAVRTLAASRLKDAEKTDESGRLPRNRVSRQPANGTRRYRRFSIGQGLKNKEEKRKTRFSRWRGQ